VLVIDASENGVFKGGRGAGEKKKKRREAMAVAVDAASGLKVAVRSRACFGHRVADCR